MTRPEPQYPAKPRPGDKVAVVSPSAGLPGLFPLPHELGLRRLREDFGLEPVEYPTTRTMGATPQARAADLHAAFADPEIKAVISSIGGDDQITVLPHLDRELIGAHPKPFFGFSDNTNLLAFLHNAGVVGYHGGSVMCQFGRPHAMDKLTETSLRAALCTSGEFELTASDHVSEVNRDWADPVALEEPAQRDPADGWTWHRADRVVDARSWGGCLEVLSWLLMADREIAPVADYAGKVLFLETTEEMPSAQTVHRILRNMGERGLLRQFPALLMARPKAWSFDQPLGPAARADYRAAQREAVLRALREYAPETMAVFDVDFGHTDPQLVLPFGGRIRVDGPDRRITVTY